MKKVIIILLTIFCVGTLRAQGRRMFIYLTNGQRIVFDTGTISKITFTPAKFPKYDAINFFTRYVIPSPDVHYTDSVDSLTFGDTSIADYIAIYDPSQEIAGIPNRFPIDRPHGVDSITFSQFETDTNIIELSNDYWDSNVGNTGEQVIGDYPCAVWKNNRIYAAEPLKYFDLDSSYQPLRDSTVYPLKGGVRYMFENKSGTKILTVESPYRDVSLGTLHEYDTQKDSSEAVIVDDSNISSAEYYGNDSILYYTYGSYSAANLDPPDAGYYFFNRRTGSKTQILHFISELGPEEMINGFDISPDGKTLLIASTGNRAPIIIEYDLASHVLDTLDVRFAPSYDRWALWVRYNHDGTKILYGNYPLGSFSQDGVEDTSEIGIIDLTTNSKTILSTNPTTEGTWINVFPEWSPDETAILYGSAAIFREPLGMVGNFQVCILKSLK